MKMNINPNFPLVTITAPIRSRQKILPYYLNGILSQTFPHSNTQLLFVINNSTDNSENILNEFKKQYENEYMRIRIEKYNRPNVPEDKRIRNVRPAIYTHLAEMRNYIAQQVKTEWQMSVDSDIILLPDTIEKLIDSKKKCISALICNGHEFAKTQKVNPYDYTNIMNKDAKGRYFHIPKTHWKGIIQINMTGAVYLIHKDIFKKCKYKNDITYGEDIPFCKDVENLGETLWCDTDIRLPHLMNEELLEKYKNEEFFF